MEASMEFNEKLQELRKSRSLTQEQLAQELYVSRTAISKWESGRGYPSIDSLKEISRFFSIKIDDLICSDEIIVVAEREKEDFASKYISLICGSLDVFVGILLVIPAFGMGDGAASTVPLFAMESISPWIKTVFVFIIAMTALNGIAGILTILLDKPSRNKHLLVAGGMLSIVGVVVFLATRQPYAGLVYFAVLVMKAFGFIVAHYPSIRK